MSDIHAEYHRFLEHLSTRGVPEDVHRLANLIYGNLEHLAEVGAARRSRSARLVSLAIEHFEGTNPIYSERLENAAPGAVFERLTQLRVGPFRGFMRPEEFDLSRDITLIYGANGTGKSSFFEALELAMLGSISEAQVKRLDLREYCNNARIGRHTEPVLLGQFGGANSTIQRDESRYRFCFIEKNRLDDFARIAARTTGDRRQLIAALFGLDQFSEFVRGFNPELDQNLMLIGNEAKRLAEQRQQIANAEQIISGYAQAVASIEAEEEAYAERIYPGFGYRKFVDWLLGTPHQLGRLPYVQAQLDAPLPTIHNITQAKLNILLNSAYENHNAYNSVQALISARANEISFQNLYDAVLAFAEGAESCPACGTALTDVSENPFDKARSGLDQLRELADLQKQEVVLRNQLNEVFRVLLEEMRRVLLVAQSVCPHKVIAENLPNLPEHHLGDWLAIWVADEKLLWKKLLEIATLIEVSDKQARDAHKQRDTLVTERDTLIQYRLDIEGLRTRRTDVGNSLRLAQENVARFNAENQALIQLVENEVPVVQLHKRIKAAYDAFLPEIQSYLAALPGLMIEGLGTLARDLYNSFNRDDLKGDYLAGLFLPVTESQRIEVVFAGEPDVRYDALVVLSEGHIKCLGLAILLAKNIQQSCPVVIFDDVVNAIDDDHRNGIWRTFFEDHWLDGKQVILTSHAEEFLLRIQQELGSARAAAIKCYKFLPHNGEHELRVDSDPPTKNYVLLAQRAVDDDDKRDALRQARPALESLTDRLWTWLGKKGEGRIELKLSGPRADRELNNKCVKLRHAVGRITGNYLGLSEAVNALSELLNVGGTSIEWSYLNGGTHDSVRGHEFDRATVKKIVDAITELDTALDVLQNRQ
ncbi:AAA family ATPase [Undibacterium luofuense]|uniref:AAA family ATPase n=1 Tax=Undibacterium luofuense TaxID=2828733 RepID=A0A941DK95_9BURK|nr:AAA family ATPase [Undibacterium luofuense]MBR7782328.1 AAA family ATPase [Undibacterium luofuense]